MAISFPISRDQITFKSHNKTKNAASPQVRIEGVRNYDKDNIKWRKELEETKKEYEKKVTRRYKRPIWKGKKGIWQCENNDNDESDSNDNDNHNDDGDKHDNNENDSNNR